MSSSKWLLLLILVLAIGCGEQPIAPTGTAPVSDGAEETATANAALTPVVVPSLPATPSPASATSPFVETVEPTDSLPPAASLEPTPPTSLSLSAPEAEATLEVGGEVTVVGEVTPGAGALTVTLEAAGVTLLENRVALQDTTRSWETVLAIPETFTGPALLRVSRLDEMIERSVLLRRPGTSGTIIELTHPDLDSTAVSGHVLFFTGQVQEPIDNQVTIAVLYQECQAVGARQTFEVGQGGRWWGFVLIPDTVFGSGCAIAYTGGFEEEGWRASATRLTILQADAPGARGLFLGNFAREEIFPGESVTVFGSAFNTTLVDVGLEVDGLTVTEGTADVNPFGYWEVDLVLPANVPAGSAGFYVATTVYGGEVVEERSPFSVVAQ